MRDLGDWHDARVDCCLKPGAPIGLSPLTLGNASPAAHNLGNYRGKGESVPFVNSTFEWGVVFATILLLSVLSVVPHHCVRLTDFL